MDKTLREGVNKMKEQALVIIKPDGLVKSLTGDIISKLSNPKRIIVGAKILSVSRELAEQKDLVLLEDSELLEEVAGLVEWAVPLMGSIDEEFMDIPAEALTS